MKKLIIPAICFSTILLFSFKYQDNNDRLHQIKLIAEETKYSVINIYINEKISDDENDKLISNCNFIIEMADKCITK